MYLEVKQPSLTHTTIIEKYQDSDAAYWLLQGEEAWLINCYWTNLTCRNNLTGPAKLNQPDRLS